MESLVVFLHLPKTGGSSVEEILRRTYGGYLQAFRGHRQINTAQKFAERIRPNAAVVSGHIPYGVHRYLDRPVQYITMLREPVSRLVSSYAWLRSQLSFDEWLSWVAEHAPHKLDVMSRLLSAECFEGRDPDLTSAKANLLACDVVGTTERWSDFVYRCTDRFGWRPIAAPIRKQNQVLNPGGRYTVPIDLQNRVRELNPNDWELYQWWLNASVF